MPRSQALLSSALLLACVGCANVQVQSRWQPEPLELTASAAEWSQVPWAGQGDLQVKALNDGQNLYLNFSSASPEIKAQWLGAFKQSFTLWVDPTGHRARTHGLKLQLLPPADRDYPYDAREQWDYLNSCDRQVAFVGADAPASAQPLSPAAAGVEWDAHGSGPTLVYQLRIPLKADSGAFGLGCAPGQAVELGLEASPIEPWVGQRVLAESAAKNPASEPPQGEGEVLTPPSSSAAMGGAFGAAGAMAGMGGGHHHHSGGAGAGEGGEGRRAQSGHAKGEVLTQIPDPIQTWIVLSLAQGK